MGYVMTPEQVKASIAKAAREVESINVASIRSVAVAAIPLIEEPWPVATGLSQEGWDDVPTLAGADVVNPVPYASDVHNGLAATLVPTVISSLDEEWEAAVNKQLLPIFEGR